MIESCCKFMYFLQMCSLQTSTGTALTHREEENRMTGAAVDEDDELLLFFCRLAGGAVDELLALAEDILFIESSNLR